MKLLLTFCAVLTIQNIRADSYSLGPVSPANDDPNWILGPSKAALGDYATIRIPEGYRFTDAKGARVLLQRMRNPISPTLIGLFAPDSGKWWLVLDAIDVGYLQGLNKDVRLDSKTILTGVRARVELDNLRRARQGGTPIASINWSKAPVFDAADNTLEWCLRAETIVDSIVNLEQVSETNTVLNSTIRLIGRSRILGLTAVQGDLADRSAADSFSMKDLIKNVSFNPGQRYSDFKPGDKIAAGKLEQLIIGDPLPVVMPQWVWIAIGCGGVLVLAGLIGGLYWLGRRMLRKERMSRAFPDYQEYGHALAPVFSNGKVHNGARRRREFNYHKFYSDMMLEVSSGPTVLQPVDGVNGKRVAAADRVMPTTKTSVDLSILQANRELIANQTQLIAEQKRLLQEQGKLIEEKSRLIHEKTQLLEKQAELLERDIL